MQRGVCKDQRPRVCLYRKKILSIHVIQNKIKESKFSEGLDQLKKICKSSLTIKYYACYSLVLRTVAVHMHS